MARLKSPFVEKAISCPVCKRKWKQRFFRQRMFMPAEKESDQHVLRYKWLTQDVQKVHPQYYSLFFCPHCKYTDTSDDFGKPDKSPSGRRVLKEFTKSAGNTALIQLIAQHIDYEDIDFESALNLHFLAILLQSLSEEDLQDAYKLARLYLRVAWLYRERDSEAAGGAEPDQEPETTGAVSEKATVEVAEEPPEEVGEEAREDVAPVILETIEAMESSLEEIQHQWRDLQQLLRKRIHEITGASQFAGANSYSACYAALNQLLEKQRAELERLKNVCMRDVTGILVKPKPPAPEPPKPPAAEPTTEKPARLPSAFASHEAFLQRVKAFWPEAPLSEHEALETAIKLFKRALAVDPRFDSAQNHLNGSMLVADLMIRCDDFKGALEVVKGMYKPAVDARQQIQEKLRKKGLSNAEQRRLQGRMKRAAEVLEKAGDMRRHVLEMMVAHDMPKVQQAIEKFGPNGADLEQALVSHGIAPEVVTELKKPGGLLAQSSRK